MIGAWILQPREMSVSVSLSPRLSGLGVTYVSDSDDRSRRGVLHNTRWTSMQTQLVMHHVCASQAPGIGHASRP